MLCAAARPVQYTCNRVLLLLCVVLSWHSVVCISRTCCSHVQRFACKSRGTFTYFNRRCLDFVWMRHASAAAPLASQLRSSFRRLCVVVGPHIKRHKPATHGVASCLYSSVVRRQSCKLKVLGSISSGGSMCGSAHINTHKATDFDTEDSSPSRLRLEMPELIARCFEHRTPLQRRYQCMDTLGIEPRASRMLSGRDTTTPCAQMIACQA